MCELVVHVRAVDLTNRDDTGAVVDALERDGLGVDVFVNNAGFGDYGPFERREWDKIERMLELNVVSTTFLLHRLVPPMIARGTGAILNVGSVAGVIPSPLMGVYAATKAYMNHLSEGLRAELADTGVTMTVVCPGPVSTEFQEVAGSDARPEMPAMFHVDAVTCAQAAVDAMKAGRARVIPGAPLKAAVLAFEALPKAVVRPFLKGVVARFRENKTS